MSDNSAVFDDRVSLAGRYRLEARIAAGGVGEVWRATDLVLDRPVAVKLLRAEFADHAETRGRFRAEARHAGSLSHPGIAQVYDYGQVNAPDSPGVPYLVMELVDGPSLAAVLAGGPLDPVRTMDVVAQAAAGLDAAHRAGLVHRDIKPANLLVGPGGQIKITDFGIAHAAGSAPITRLGALVGTPAYLAPERAAGWRARPASDLYSLGVVAYQCLTAEVPFTGMPVEVALAHRDREFPPLPAAVPLPVAALIAELTAKDPAARPASAGDVARRAARVRDAMAGRGGGGTSAAPGGLDLAESHPTLVDRFAPFESPPRTATLPRAPASPHRRRGRGSRVSKLGLALAAAAAVIAGLIGWLVADATQPSPAPVAAPAGHVRSIRTVEVNGTALAGQPVSLVSHLLRQLGLHPRVVRAAHGNQPPGTVVSVSPTGQVAVGSIVTVEVVAKPHGHRPHHRDGPGPGNGQ